MKIYKLYLHSLLALLISTPSILQSSILAYEDFESTAEWTATSGGQAPNTNKPNLTFGNLSTTGSAADSTWASAYISINHNLQTEGELWISWLMQIDDSLDNNWRAAQIQINPEDNGNVQFNMGASGDNVGNTMFFSYLNTDYSGAYTGVNLTEGNVYLQIVKLTASAGTVLGEAWIYDNGTVPNSTPSGGATWSKAAGTTITQVGISAYATTGVIDELRIGTTFADVVPTAAVTPTDPSDLTVDTVSPTSVSLSWAGTGDFVIERSTSPDGGFSQIGTVNTTSYTVSNLTQDTEYFFRVKLSAGTEYTNVVAATPRANSTTGGKISKTQNVKIMPMGDSITYGVNGSLNYPPYENTQGGYRLYLEDHLQANGYTFDFVGDYLNYTPEPNEIENAHTSWWSDGMDDVEHEGWPGNTIDQITAHVTSTAVNIWNPTNGGQDVYGYDSINRFDPDLFLVMCGTNDMRINNLGFREENINAMKRLIDAIYLDQPNAIVLLGGVVLATEQNNLFYDDSQTFNSRLQSDIVSWASGKGYDVTYVDTATNVEVGGDGIHPNDAGYQSMAQRWYDAIVAITGTSNTTPTIPNTPTSLSVSGSGTTLTLSWIDNSNNEDRFIIERSANGSSGWTVIANNVSSNTTTYSDTGLTENDTWYYRVKSDNAQGNSANYSNIANAEVGAASATIRKGAEGNPLLIMPIGDSITLGYSPDQAWDNGGYRDYLYDLLVADGYVVESVGGETMNSGTVDSNFKKHNGYSAQNINDLNEMLYNGRTTWIVNSQTNTTPDAPGSVARYQPEVVLMMLGTNNVYGGAPSSGTDAAMVTYETLVNNIVNDVPNAVIFVAKIVQKSGAQNEVNYINTKIEEMVTKLAGEGKNVALVDHSAVPYGSDNVHPYDSGFQTMAQNWFDAIKAYTGAGSSTGGYTDWAASKGVGSATDDDDNDGYSNLAEYAFGMEPTDDSMSNAPTLELNNSHLEMIFNRDSARNDIDIIIEASSDLSTWTPIAQSLDGGDVTAVNGLSSVTQGSGASPKVRDSTALSSSPRFIRVRVETN